MNDLLELIGVSHYTVYLHDYGAPVGLRLATAHPERVEAFIVQNGNVYRAGLGEKWAKISEYWQDPAAHPEVLSTFLSFEATKDRHLARTQHPERYNPDSWMREYADLSRPGQSEVQGSLLYD